MLRLKTDAKHNTEIVEALESLTIKNLESPSSFYFIPRGISKQFFGREEQLTAIHDSFLGGDQTAILLTLLHGLGGVGKSRLALRYIERHRAELDAIIWLSADSVVKLEQDLTEVAQRLGLSTNQGDSQDSSSATIKVREWLTGSGK